MNFSQLWLTRTRHTPLMNHSIASPQSLNHLTIIKFSGADTSTFLQGQLSNDVNELNGSWQFSGYCNPKGRLLALLQLWQHDDAIYAVVDKSLSGGLVKRLRMYVMRSKVVIEELSDARCYGVNAPAALSKRFSLELTPDSVTLHYGGRQLIVDFADNHPSSQINREDWVSTNILDGLPSICAQTSELFVPQMVNLDLIGGINFKKGCYTGQEIVARMHYLGKLKQRMFVCRIESNTNIEAPSRGAKILASDNSGVRKTAGNLVSISSKDQLALAVLRTEMVEDKQNFNFENGAVLVVHNEQPYKLRL